MNIPPLSPFDPILSSFSGINLVIVHIFCYIPQVMARFTIKAHKRSELKKLKNLLKKGFTPAVVYNQAGESISIKIASNEVQKMLESVKGTPLVNISVEDDEHQTALIREVQNDLRTNTPNHVSFMALDPNKEAVFDVQINPIGESLAVRNNLGVLIMSRNSLELRGLPKDIPTHLEIDITSLQQVGDNVSVSDLHIPEGLDFVHEEDKELSVATIQPFQKTYEEEKQEEEAAAAAKAAESEEEGEEGATTDATSTEAASSEE